MKTPWQVCMALRRPLPSRKFNPWQGKGRRVRLLATIMVRNEIRFLPGLLRNIASQVDGIIALDDGSSDGSDRLLEKSALVLELLRNPPCRPGWDQPGNHRRLVEAALRQGAEWIIAVDADERLEREFRTRAERVIQRGRPLGLTAFGVHFRELWDSPRSFRADGIWGRKTQPRFFQARADHQFDERPIHGAKAPLQGKVRGFFPLADLIIYHLRMVRRDDRQARRQRNEQLDPQARCQPGIGYAYLTDETGLSLRPVPARRGFEE
jgi:glycosyltransferase involved in cell wall biosynthesis